MSTAWCWSPAAGPCRCLPRPSWSDRSAAAGASSVPIGDRLIGKAQECSVSALGEAWSDCVRVRTTGVRPIRLESRRPFTGLVSSTKSLQRFWTTRSVARRARARRARVNLTLSATATTIREAPQCLRCRASLRWMSQCDSITCTSRCYASGSRGGPRLRLRHRKPVPRRCCS